MYDVAALLLFVVGGSFILSRLLHAVTRALAGLPGTPELAAEGLSTLLAMQKLREIFGGTVEPSEEPGSGGGSYSERVMDGLLDISYARISVPDEGYRYSTAFRFRPGSPWEGKPTVATMKYLAPAFVDIDHGGLVVSVSAWVEHPLFLKWFRGMVLRLVAELSSTVEQLPLPPAPAPCPLRLDQPVPWDATCKVCGTGLAVERAVYCPKCQTPHHESCWEYAGGCSVYGCSAQNR